MNLETNEAANILLIKSKNLGVPINLAEVAGMLDLDKPVKILYVYNLPPQIGAYTFKGRLKYYICVNSKHPAVRQRFSIAHEIGHLALGHKESSIHSWSRYYGKIETEADEFAADLLMPDNGIQFLLFKFSFHVPQSKFSRHIPLFLEKFTKFFEVSLSAAARRITELGLFSGAIMLQNDDNIEFNYQSPEYNGSFTHQYQKALSTGKLLHISVSDKTSRMISRL